MSTQTIQPTIIDAGTVLTGRIDQGQYIHIHGTIEGELQAAHVLVHEGGTFIGKLIADNAEIHGIVQGEVAIKHLIDIGVTGDVSGKVEYGELALKAGGNLEASVHNIPPVLTGDLDLTVQRGKTIAITTRDLNAVDPDDVAEDLTFTVLNPANGWLALASETSRPVNTFTQADLAAQQVAFVHDGTQTRSASFEISLSDSKGASAGAPQRVTVHIE